MLVTASRNPSQSQDPALHWCLCWQLSEHHAAQVAAPHGAVPRSSRQAHDSQGWDAASVLCLNRFLFFFFFSVRLRKLKHLLFHFYSMQFIQFGTYIEIWLPWTVPVGYLSFILRGFSRLCSVLFTLSVSCYTSPTFFFLSNSISSFAFIYSKVQSAECDPVQVRKCQFSVCDSQLMVKLPSTKCLCFSRLSGENVLFLWFVPVKSKTISQIFLYNSYFARVRRIRSFYSASFLRRNASMKIQII